MNISFSKFSKNDIKKNRIILNNIDELNIIRNKFISIDELSFCITVIFIKFI